MREVTIVENALPVEIVAPMREALMASILVGKNVLTGTFEGTRGFSIIFKRDGLPKLRERLPEALPFLDLVLTDQAQQALRSWPGRILGGRYLKSTNAFYFNLLVMPPKSRVTPHVEGTLTTACGLDWHTPVANSVFYLHAPKAGGGQLCVHGKGGHRHTVIPRLGTLAHFRGDLLHEVLPTHAAEAGDNSADFSSQRISLVCEQYRIDPAQLHRVPSYQVDSRGYFDRIMKRARHRDADGSPQATD